MNKKPFVFGILLVLLAGCQLQDTESNKSARQILELSKTKHDPTGIWNNVAFEIHIQEPRPQTPLRYSILYLNNETGEFKLTREIAEGIVERVISEDGEAKVLLNGNAKFSEKIKDEYNLNANRNSGYRSFYTLISGLPMSLNNSIIDSLVMEDEDQLKGKDVYVISMILKETIISNEWEIFISKEDYSLVGMKFNHPENSGRDDELIYFEGLFSFKELSLPRFRHWYIEGTQEYLGSDIIVKEIQ